MQSNNAKPDISPLNLSRNTKGGFVTAKHDRFFPFHHQPFPTFKQQTDGRNITWHRTRHLCPSSCPPPVPLSGSGASRLFLFSSPSQSSEPRILISHFSPPETAQHPGDGLLSLRLAQGNKRRTSIHRRLRREPGQPTGAWEGGGDNQRSRPSFEMLLLTMENVRPQKRSPPSHGLQGERWESGFQWVFNCFRELPTMLGRTFNFTRWRR